MTGFKRKIPAGIRYRHCGKWHYGHSTIDEDTAFKLAERNVESCGRTRYILGMPDELLGAEAPS